MSDLVLVGLVALVLGLLVGWTLAAHQEREYVEDLERRLELLRRLVRMHGVGRSPVTAADWLRLLDEHRPAHVTLEQVLHELHVAAERRRAVN